MLSKFRNSIPALKQSAWYLENQSRLFCQNSKTQLFWTKLASYIKDAEAELAVLSENSRKKNNADPLGPKACAHLASILDGGEGHDIKEISGNIMKALNDAKFSNLAEAIKIIANIRTQEKPNFSLQGKSLLKFYTDPHFRELYETQDILSSCKIHAGTDLGAIFFGEVDGTHWATNGIPLSRGLHERLKHNLHSMTIPKSEDFNEIKATGRFPHLIKALKAIERIQELQLIIKSQEESDTLSMK